VDVDDVVGGILAAAERGESGRRYVLGGENLPFGRIMATIARVTGSRGRRMPVPRIARRPMQAAAWLLMRVTGSRFLTPQIVGDMFAWKYYSSERAAAELGWTPGYRFEQSVQRAWDYYVKQGLLC
jgi:dihydroflavonol-4-reductase